MKKPSGAWAQWACLSAVLLIGAPGGHAADCEARAFSGHEQTVLSAYIAYYGRPADVGGLAWWANELAVRGGNLSSIIAAFGNSLEFDQRFGRLGHEALVNNLYRQLFGRDAEPAGLAWYAEELAAQRRSLSRIALDILYGAQGEDQVVLNNRFAVAEHYVTVAEALGTSARSPSAAVLSELIEETGARWTSAVAACQDVDDLLVGASAGEDAYLPGKAAPGSVAPLRGQTSVIAGQELELALSDGTMVVLPGVSADYSLTLERQANNAIDLASLLPAGSDVVTSGALRSVAIGGSGDPNDLRPLITFPLAEAGSLNLETIAVLRQANTWVEGESVPGHLSILPVEVDTEGLRVVDALLPDSLHQIYFSAASSATDSPPRARAGGNWVGEVKYSLISFEGSVNWANPPRLVRMIPDAERADEGYRRPATTAERDALERQPLCNMVVLVHGHNEEEKAGDVAEPGQALWQVGYKRRVWDLVYKTYLDRADYPQACTAFYEFIYPTYRPIFSAVPDKSGWRHATLGEDFGRLVTREFERNAQLRGLLKEEMPFKLSIVAHSMGGLVARAGLRHTPTPVLKRLHKLVTWGSPHQGAGLYSLLYALRAGHDLVVDGYRIPLHNIGRSARYQNLISDLALDTPGVRDMRWSAQYKQRLRLGELMVENTLTGFEDQQTELPNGSLFYSSNLAAFNDAEGRWMNGLLDGKYVFYHGVTSRIAETEVVNDSWLPWRRYPLLSFGLASPTAQGAWLNQQVMAIGYGASDGAAALISQRGDGLPGPAGIARFDVGDVDHEEFYGSEPAQRTGQTLAKGERIARLSHLDAGLEAVDSACPEVEARLTQSGSNVSVAGRLLAPHLAVGGDGPGRKVARVELRGGGLEGRAVTGLTVTVEDDGHFSLQGEGSGLAGQSKAGVVVVFKDGSEAGTEVPVTADESRFLGAAISDPWNEWTITASRAGHFSARSSRVGHRLDGDLAGLGVQCTLSADWTMPTAIGMPLEITVTQTVLVDSKNWDLSDFEVHFVLLKTLPVPGQAGGLEYIHVQAYDLGGSKNRDSVNRTTTRTMSFNAYKDFLGYFGSSKIERGPSLYIELDRTCGGTRWVDDRGDGRSGDVTPRTGLHFDYDYEN